MKFFYKIMKIIPVAIIVLLVNINPGCKDPYDYGPPFDSLIPPPDAPQLLHPRDDTTFNYDIWHPWPNDIELELSSVEGTIYYELHASIHPSFPGEPTKVYNSVHTLTLDASGLYYWKVRAYNSDWEWYTEWSETWIFLANYSP